MSVVDTIYQRMKDDTETIVEETKLESEIGKFFAGLNVFVTGGTDILGKCLLEKLLRDCPEVKNVYVLIRTKKGEEFDVKCNKLYQDNVFDILRKSNAKFTDKLKPIQGDLSRDRLGLSDEDLKTLTENVNVIFHNGAATKLNEQISIALKTNVLGTKRMLDLARECKHLKTFFLVSTAFSHCHERVIEEKFYRAPADLKTVEDMIEADTAPSGLTDDSLKMLLGDWPNVFTYTKATAEDLVQQHAVRASYACCVFRPSLLISTYKEPVPGWCDNKNGPASFFAKIAMGAIHVMYRTDYPCDLIPADLSANAMLVCAWDSVDRWQVEPEAFVYNYGTSQEKPITMREIREKILEDEGALVCSKSKRKPYVIFASNFIMYFALRIILDYIPALIVDVLTMLHGQAPEAWSMLRESMGEMCRACRFTSGNWRIRTTETMKACDRLNDRDKELFFCDVRQLNWDDFFLTYWRGIRVYFLREQLAGIDVDRRCPCSKCPCKCKCACYGIMFLLGFLAYYAFTSIFF